jgi:DNA polymerase-3 subunit alpha
VWRQVSSFAGYSFSKAHSSSYAVESFQDLKLKLCYPREFMVGVLNNYGGFYNRALYVHELQKAGAIVHLPSVNHSDSEVNISGIDVYLGLIGIHGLESSFIEKIPEERRQNGLYQGLEDLIRRTGIGLEQAITLIRVGALRFTGKSKKELLWQVHRIMDIHVKPTNELSLFQVDAKHYVLPSMVSTKLEDAYHELELLGFPLSLSFFDMLETEFRGEVMADDLVNHVGKTVRMVGRYVDEKTVRTKHGQRMYFGCFLDADGNFFDTTHFPNHTSLYPFRGAGCYLIEGKVVEDFSFASLEVTRCEKLKILDNPVMALD